MAFCAIAGAGSAGAQGLWEDSAFALYHQAVEALPPLQREAVDLVIADFPVRWSAGVDLVRAAKARWPR